MDRKIEQIKKVMQIIAEFSHYKYLPDDIGSLSKRIVDALYSSQEPQKSEKQKVADLLGVPLSEVHTLDIQDGKLVEIVDVPQSVSTPTEGMELSEEEIRQVSIPESYDREMMIARQIAKAQLQKIIDILEGK